MLVTMVPDVINEIVKLYGDRTCGYYFVNGLHAAEREEALCDDHSDIRENKEPSTRPQSAASPVYRVCVRATCRLATPPPSVKKLISGGVDLLEEMSNFHPTVAQILTEFPPNQ